MAYPYADLRHDFTNDTPIPDVHPADHNDMGVALNDLKAELGINPKGAAATLTDRLDLIDTTLTSTDPFPIYASDQDLADHETATSQSHSAASVALDPVPGMSSRDVQAGVLELRTAINAVAVGGVPEKEITFFVPGILTVQTGVAGWLSRVAQNILGVRALAGGAPAGRPVILDVLVEGVSIFAAPSIISAAVTVKDTTDLTSFAFNTPALPVGDSGWQAGDYMIAEVAYGANMNVTGGLGFLLGENKITGTVTGRNSTIAWVGPTTLSPTVTMTTNVGGRAVAIVYVVRNAGSFSPTVSAVNDVAALSLTGSAFTADRRSGAFMALYSANAGGAGTPTINLDAAQTLMGRSGSSGATHAALALGAEYFAAGAGAVGTLPARSAGATVSSRGNFLGFAIYPNLPGIAAGSKKTGAEALPSVPLVPANSAVTIDVVQIGNTTAGSDLTVMVRLQDT